MEKSPPAFTIIPPDGALRQKHIKKVKSTYDHLCGLLVRRSSQRRGNVEKKEVFITINKGKTEEVSASHWSFKDSSTTMMIHGP